MSAFNWDPLRDTVLGAIERGQIGRPATLRMTVHGPGGESERRELETELRDIASAWFGGLCVSEYATGGDKAAKVVALKWSGGQSAVLSLSTGVGHTGGNVVLLGSNGAIYHEIDSIAVDESRVVQSEGAQW